MQPSKIDVFGRDLFITSLDRSKVVTLDKFAGLINSSHDTNVSSILNSQVLHAGDLIVVHPAKLMLRESKLIVINDGPAGWLDTFCCCN